MKQAVNEFRIRTRGKGLYEFTAEVEAWVAEQRMTNGLLTLFCRHTSASLLVQENADPDVQTDLNGWFERLAPESDPRYVHTLEGPDDMPAHLRSAVTPVQLTIPLMAAVWLLAPGRASTCLSTAVRPTRAPLPLTC